MSTTDGPIWVVPSVSFGNVPQLVADLLLNNCEVSGPTAIDAPFVLPFLGSTQGTFDGVATALDVSKSADDRLLLFQQRAPVRSHCNRKQAEFLLALPQEVAPKPSLIVLMHSVHAAYRLDADLYVSEEGPCNPSAGVVTNALFDQLADSSPLSLSGLTVLPTEKALQDSSFPNALLQVGTASGIPVVVLVYFSNGGGIPESFQLFFLLFSMLKGQLQLQ